jgi:hypothetical protein
VAEHRTPEDSSFSWPPSSSDLAAAQLVDLQLIATSAPPASEVARPLRGESRRAVAGSVRRRRGPSSHHGAPPRWSWLAAGVLLGAVLPGRVDTAPPTRFGHLPAGTSVAMNATSLSIADATRLPAARRPMPGSGHASAGLSATVGATSATPLAHARPSAPSSTSGMPWMTAPGWTSGKVSVGDSLRSTWHQALMNTGFAGAQAFAGGEYRSPGVPPATVAPVGPTLIGARAAKEATSPREARREMPATADAATRSVLGTVQTFRTAWSRLDAASTRRVWPAADRAALTRTFTGISEQRLTLRDCAVSVGGQDATARCAGTLRYRPRVGDQATRTRYGRWDFGLKRQQAGWVITTVRAPI